MLILSSFKGWRLGKEVGGVHIRAGPHPAPWKHRKLNGIILDIQFFTAELSQQLVIYWPFKKDTKNNIQHTLQMQHYITCKRINPLDSAVAKLWV